MARRKTVAAGLAALTATASIVITGGQSAAAGTTLNAHGITILTAAPPAGPRLSDAQRTALDSADLLSEQDPDNLSFPYFDGATGTVIVTAATTTGHTKAAGPAGLPTRTASDPKGHLRKDAPSATAHRVADVKHSRRMLQHIMDDAIGVGPLTTVGSDYPDAATNKIVLEVTVLSQPVLDELAAKYDPTAIEVFQTAPDRGLPSSGRGFDTWPFQGGDVIHVYGGDSGLCTGGWPWHSYSNGVWSDYMVTAGHCSPHDGPVTTGQQDMGHMFGNESSWSASYGSWELPGQSDYTGDIGLVHLDVGYNAIPSIYVGAVGSTATRPVKQMWSVRPSVGDQYCEGGALGGETCGWVTRGARVNWTYTDGTVARNISWGSKDGQCIVGGDSGGPVYTYRSDGGIAAKGMTSGGTNQGGTNGCRHVYSDIWDAYYAYPGNLQTQ